MSSKGTSGSTKAGMVIGAIVLAVIGAFLWAWGINIVHWFTADFREYSSFWIPTIIGGVLAIHFASRGVKENSDALKGLGLILAILGLILGSVIGAFYAPYYMAKSYYENSTQTVENALAPSFSERAPYELAVRTSDKSLMNVTGDSQITKALSDEGEVGEWNTLVVERGYFKGYEAVQNLNLPLYGASQNNNVKFCYFSDDATLRDHGAVPGNNLSRAIFLKVPVNVDYEEGDMYSYCNDAGEPVVVVPLKQIDGWMFPTWKAYGVAVYNGQTGDLKIVKDVNELNEIPGPIYPESLAASQRDSLIANGTWWQMIGEKVSGYVAASDNTEVNLRLLDKNETEYVTALMPRGSSTSLVGVSHVSATTMTPGGYNKLTVAKFADENVRPANSTLIDDLKTRYGHMPEFANDSLGVFEITAGKDGGWVVSLGREESVNYRAYVSPAGDKIELFDRAGKLIAQGASSSEGEDGGTVDMVPTDVSTLSVDELNALGKAVMDELAKRSK